MSITAIEREFGDHVVQFMEAVTDQVVMDRYGITQNTLFRWEETYGVRCKRQCRVCQGTFAHKDMTLGKKGQVVWGMCKPCFAKTPSVAGTRRLESEYQGLPDHFAFPATAGFLRCYYMQGGIFDIL